MTTEFLKNLGLNEDQIKQVFAENGKDIQSEKGKYTQLQSQFDEATMQIGALNETIKGNAGNDALIEELRGKVKAFEDAEVERTKAAQEAQRKANITARFDAQRGEKKWLNEGTAKWIYDEFDKAVNDSSNSGKSDAEIYESVTKNRNIYVNEQRQAFTNPPAGRMPTLSADEQYLRDKYGSNPWADFNK